MDGFLFLGRYLTKTTTPNSPIYLSKEIYFGKKSYILILRKRGGAFGQNIYPCIIQNTFYFPTFDSNVYVSGKWVFWNIN